MSKRNAISRVIPWLALFTALVIFPALYYGGVMSVEKVNQLGRFMCYAIVAMGVDLIWGYTGILSLCQAMFFCFGAYAMGMHLALQGDKDPNGIPACLAYVSSDVKGFQLPWFWQPFHTFPVALVLGVLIPGLVAFAFGYFAFRSRVRGVYFSIITQATTLAAWNVFSLNNMRLGGTNGLTRFDTILGMKMREPHGKVVLYFVTVAVLTAVYFICRHLVNSRAGRILVAIRDNESRLRFSGYHPVYYKVFIFVVAAVISAIGGMLFIPQEGIITPSNMGVTESIIIVVWVAVGGRGTLSGAVLGAIAINYVYSFTTSAIPSLWPFVLGGLAIGVVRYFPSGLIGAWHRLMGEADADERVQGHAANSAESEEKKTTLPAKEVSA